MNNPRDVSQLTEQEAKALLRITEAKHDAAMSIVQALIFNADDIFECSDGPAKKVSMLQNIIGAAALQINAVIEEIAMHERDLSADRVKHH